MRVNLVQFSDNRIASLKDATNSDPELAALRDVIIKGWPERRRMVAKPLQPYWSFRDELSIEAGLLLMSGAVLIPTTQQKEILDKIHEAHQGITTCHVDYKEPSGLFQRREHQVKAMKQRTGMIWL